MMAARTSSDLYGDFESLFHRSLEDNPLSIAVKDEIGEEHASYNENSITDVVGTTFSPSTMDSSRYNPLQNCLGDEKSGYVRPFAVSETSPINERDKSEIFQILGLDGRCQLYSDTGESADVTANSRAKYFSSSMPLSNCLDNRLLKNLGSTTESGTLESELLRLYFQYFHPACPAIDDTEFMGQYYNHKYLEEDLSPNISLLLQAMMFIAFAYVNATQLDGSQYSSIKEGQQDLFNKARALYHSRDTVDNITLAQAALLLSHWGPKSPENETNGIWIDRAFSHAKQANLHHIRWSPDKKRERLVWVCCLIRGRILSYHSPLQHQTQMWKYSADLLSIEDFEDDLNVSYHRESLLKREAAHSFIALTRLSDLMGNILKLETSSARNTPSPTQHPRISGREILEVNRQDKYIREWVYDQEDGLAIGGWRRTHPLSTPVLSIMKDALIFQLWSPYIYVGTYEAKLSLAFEEHALNEVEKACARIADNLGVILDKHEKEAIPLMLATWLPSAIATVFLQVHTNGANDPSLRRLGNLLRTLAVLRDRFSGAEFVYDLTNVIMQALPQRFRLTLQNGTVPFSPVPFPTSIRSGTQAKAKTLKWVFEFIRDSFALKKIKAQL